MDENQLQTMISDVELLAQQYNLLKEYVKNLTDENQALKQQNKDLYEKQEHAKAAVNDMIETLRQGQVE